MDKALNKSGRLLRFSLVRDLKGIGPSLVGRARARWPMKATAPVRARSRRCRAAFWACRLRRARAQPREVRPPFRYPADLRPYYGILSRLKKIASAPLQSGGMCDPQQRITLVALSRCHACLDIPVALAHPRADCGPHLLARLVSPRLCVEST